MPKTLEFQVWLATPEAWQLLDDSVLGCLEQSHAEEVAEEFGYDLSVREHRVEFSTAIDAALGEGL